MNNNQPTPKKAVLCLCTGTTTAQIQELIAKGMDTVEAIADETGAGTGCGGCDYLIAQLLEETLKKTR
jgi:NAD(P)H-nitrite reductase large subunit